MRRDTGLPTDFACVLAVSPSSLREGVSAFALTGVDISSSTGRGDAGTVRGTVASALAMVCIGRTGIVLNIIQARIATAPVAITLPSTYRLATGARAGDFTIHSDGAFCAFSAGAAGTAGTSASAWMGASNSARSGSHWHIDRIAAALRQNVRENAA
jgi:hypothetical protein